MPLKNLKWLLLGFGILVATADLLLHLHQPSPQQPTITNPPANNPPTPYPYYLAGSPSGAPNDGQCSGPWHGLRPGNMNPIPSCPSSPTKNRAFITMLLTPKYVEGVLKLLCSMKKVGSEYPLVVLVPPNFNQTVIQQVMSYGIQVLTVELLEFPSKCISRFSVNWTKLKLWTLTQYEKLFYLDSDTFLLKNVDDVFDYPADFAIPGDLDRTDCWGCGPMGYAQAGMFLVRPCNAVYEEMMSLVQKNETLQFQYSDAEQGFFDWYFYYDRVLLPGKYNFLPHHWWDTKLQESAKIVHYTHYKPFLPEYRKYHDPWLQCQLDLFSAE